MKMATQTTIIQVCKVLISAAIRVTGGCRFNWWGSGRPVISCAAKAVVLHARPARLASPNNKACSRFTYVMFSPTTKKIKIFLYIQRANNTVRHISLPSHKHQPDKPLGGTSTTGEQSTPMNDVLLLRLSTGLASGMLVFIACLLSRQN